MSLYPEIGHSYILDLPSVIFMRSDFKAGADFHTAKKTGVMQFTQDITNPVTRLEDTNQLWLVKIS